MKMWVLARMKSSGADIGETSEAGLADCVGLCRRAARATTSTGASIPPPRSSPSFAAPAERGVVAMSIGASIPPPQPSPSFATLTGEGVIEWRFCSPPRPSPSLAALAGEGVFGLGFWCVEARLLGHCRDDSGTERIGMGRFGCKLVRRVQVIPSGLVWGRRAASMGNRKGPGLGQGDGSRGCWRSRIRSVESWHLALRSWRSSLNCRPRGVSE